MISYYLLLDAPKLLPIPLNRADCWGQTRSFGHAPFSWETAGVLVAQVVQTFGFHRGRCFANAEDRRFVALFLEFPWLLELLFQKDVATGWR